MNPILKNGKLKYILVSAKKFQLEFSKINDILYMVK
jgi:hypothetical protein